MAEAEEKEVSDGKPRRLFSDKRRTLRSVKARNRKIVEQGYVCAACGVHITFENAEMDHTIPFRESKVTNQHDMKALCRSCNRKKG